MAIDRGADEGTDSWRWAWLYLWFYERSREFSSIGAILDKDGANKKAAATKKNIRMVTIIECPVDIGVYGENSLQHETIIFSTSIVRLCSSTKGFKWKKPDIMVSF